ncbi:MAG: hypothetical protein AAF153_02150, partial [Pseudomonadota bacterium]
LGVSQASVSRGEGVERADCSLGSTKSLLGKPSLVQNRPLMAKITELGNTLENLPSYNLEEGADKISHMAGDVISNTYIESELSQMDRFVGQNNKLQEGSLLNHFYNCSNDVQNHLRTVFVKVISNHDLKPNEQDQIIRHACNLTMLDPELNLLDGGAVAIRGDVLKPDISKCQQINELVEKLAVIKSARGTQQDKIINVINKIGKIATSNIEQVNFEVLNSVLDTLHNKRLLAKLVTGNAGDLSELARGITNISDLREFEKRVEEIDKEGRSNIKMVELTTGKFVSGVSYNDNTRYLPQ